MKYIIPLVLLLSACSSESTQQFITTQKQVVVLPDEKLYKCPIVAYFPDSKSLTDIQVARLLIQLHKNNLECKNSLTAIKAFLDKAKMTAETSTDSD